MADKNHLKTLKSIVEIVQRFQLDSIEFNGIKVTKSRHTAQLAAAPQPDAKTGAAATAKDPAEPKSRPPTTVAELDALNRGLI